MGKMSELSTLVDELRKCGETLIDIGNALGGIFGEDVPEEEHEHNQQESGSHDATQQQTAEPELPHVTLEQLRSVLAEKSANGHRTEVQALIREYGADKLSAVEPKYYADMLAKAEVL